MPVRRAAPTHRAWISRTTTPARRARSAVRSVHASATTIRWIVIRCSLLVASRMAARQEGSRSSSLCAGITTPTAWIMPARWPGPPIAARHRSRMYTSARKSGSRCSTNRASPAWAASAWCTSSPLRGYSATGCLQCTASRVPPGRRAATPQVEHLGQVATAEVVQDLREHDQVELAGRPVTGNDRALHPHVRQPRRPGIGLADGGGCPVAGQQAVAARGKLLRQHPDRAPGLEGVAVTFGRQQRQADRVFAYLIPAGLEPPWIHRAGVELVEVVHAQRHKLPTHRKSTSVPRVKWATVRAGSTGARPPARLSSWLVKQAIAAAAGLARPRHARSPQQCQVRRWGCWPAPSPFGPRSTTSAPSAARSRSAWCCRR